MAWLRVPTGEKYESALLPRRLFLDPSGAIHLEISMAGVKGWTMYLDANDLERLKAELAQPPEPCYPSRKRAP